MVVDAGGLDPGLLGNVAHGGGRVALLTEGAGGQLEKGLAGLVAVVGTGLPSCHVCQGVDRCSAAILTGCWWHANQAFGTRPLPGGHGRAAKLRLKNQPQRHSRDCNGLAINGS